MDFLLLQKIIIPLLQNVYWLRLAIPLKIALLFCDLGVAILRTKTIMLHVHFTCKCRPVQTKNIK